MMSLPAIKIAHLYPRHLNLYGDRGNVIALSRRIKWRGLEVRVEDIDINEPSKKLADFDLLFIGGGQDRQQELVAEDFFARKSELEDIFHAGKVLLAICGGYQLLGQSYQTSEAHDIEGLGILDVYTKAKPQNLDSKQDRLIGNLSAELLIEIQSELKTLVGFENHSGRSYIADEATKPLAKVIKGHGNNAEDGFEGAVKNNFFASYLHGSLLPKNPHFADELIYRAMQNSKHPYLQEHMQLQPLDDTIELQAHDFALTLN